MRKKGILLLLSIFLCFQAGFTEISSLSHLFLLGKGIKDLDGDNLGEKVALQIVIPDNPTAYELAVAADIAARANLESLAIDFALVKRESEVQNLQPFQTPIYVGSNISIIKDFIKDSKQNIPALAVNQGLVFLFSTKNQRGVALIAGSDDALLQAGRSFFLRWPYFWDIWGREEGPTYLSFENDLMKFLAEEGISLQKTVLQSALYEFPPLKTAKESLKKFLFSAGEIKNLSVDVYLTDSDDQEKAFQALEILRGQRFKGQKTEVLSYPGCGQITFNLRYGKKNLQMALPRLGYPKRILTPYYKEIPRFDSSGKDFDLLSLFSSKGFYSDRDKDTILDSLDTSIILPQNSNIKGVDQLASRLVLPTTGASFPIVCLDDEVENKKTQIAPILIGPNSLSQDLIKTGKLKIPALENNWGIVQVIPKAFNKSSALAFTGANNEALERTLSYFSRTFPYFEEYQEGKPSFSDLAQDLEKYLKGENGSAEAYFEKNLKKIVEGMEEKDLEYFKAEMYLPQKNQVFEENIQRYLGNSLKTESLEIKSYNLKESKNIFEKEKEFSWEGDEALSLIQDKLPALDTSKSPLRISVGLSESPEVRQKIKKQIELLLTEKTTSDFEVEVLSAYKQGFFWLTEKVLPSLKNKNISRLTIRFAEEKDNLSQLKRFYSEPLRWLQELYPVDEIFSRERNLPLEKIEFEMKSEKEPVYEILAFDEKGMLFFQQSFTPRTKEIPFLKVLPEWGTSKITTGWLKIEKGNEVVLDTLLQTDLEKFWDYYQEEVLFPVYSYILKKTGNEPALSKQPYFKRLQLEMWFSEPDYRLGLDEEMVSSLEAIHDEIYFDTLDFLKGITTIEPEEKDLPDDTSRYSAPGNVLPVIHPSLEGGKGKIKVTFDDWLASSPQVILKWKEKGLEELSKTLSFPSIKTKTLQIPSFIYNGQEERIENLFVEMELENETDYLTLLDIIDSYRNLLEDGSIADTFNYPKLKSITLIMRYKDLEKEERFPVTYKKPEEKALPPFPKPEELIVTTHEILSPQMCWETIRRLSQYKVIKSYSGGKSYENREIPVLEIFLPQDKYVSIPRLITYKPTLHLSSRQHANEVSSTNYSLRFAELFARDKTYQEYLKKMNIVLQPMENPDGAELAYELQKLTPFHSLHAGRYSSLGIEIGYQVTAAKPLLPEAAVRRDLTNRWMSDIYLNLHGYPSHEWIQPFSNYSPYLFRDYWIPRGWYAYYQTLSLPIYQKWKEAGEELRKFIVEEMQADERIKKSNKKFYDRYYRWAGRWQPHLDYLELYDGLNLYAKRRSSQENKLTLRSQITFVEETPEIMDETAHAGWLNFLCEQGITYLRAHLKYLAQTKFEISRIEEEIQGRIRIQFSRSRPGAVNKGK